MQDIIDKLRTSRKHSPLMQSDIAFFLGFKDSTLVSKFEKGHRSPVIDVVLLYQILFDAPVLAYFNIQRANLKQHVLNKIPDLINELEKDEGQKSKHRIECLQATFNKLVNEVEYDKN
jgi:transcriptional regulator with XRE-family HTH domain